MVDENKEVVKTRNKERMLKIIGVIVSAIIITILIIVKLNVEEFPLFWFIGGFVLIFIFFFLMFFGFGIYRKMQESKEKLKEKEEKTPSSITIEQAYEIIKKDLQSPNYADYFVGVDYQIPIVVGKTGNQTVLSIKLSQTPYCKAPYQFYLINLNYPTTLKAYITQYKLNTSEISRVAHRLAINPEDTPDVEKRVETDLSTGKQIVYEKRSNKKKEENKKEDKKPDLT